LCRIAEYKVDLKTIEGVRIEKKTQGIENFDFQGRAGEISEMEPELDTNG